MHIAAVVFGLLVASLIGAAFHVWRGGGLGRLVGYLVLSWIGFWIGHFAGNQLGWTFLSIGPLRMATAVTGSLLLLFLGYWLTLGTTEEGEGPSPSR